MESIYLHGMAISAQRRSSRKTSDPCTYNDDFERHYAYKGVYGDKLEW